MILELEVPAQHLDLVIVLKDDHTAAVVYHRDLVKHPNVQIQSEGSQDQRTQFFSNFSGPEAMDMDTMRVGVEHASGRCVAGRATCSYVFRTGGIQAPLYNHAYGKCSHFD